jgi:hypothetical protein
MNGWFFVRDEGTSQEGDLDLGPLTRIEGHAVIFECPTVENDHFYTVPMIGMCFETSQNFFDVEITRLSITKSCTYRHLPVLAGSDSNAQNHNPG